MARREQMHIGELTVDKIIMSPPASSENQGLNWAMTGEGYSLNLLSVVSTATAGEGTRGLRVNATTSDSITTGDLQCVHGYLTLGSSAGIAANAAVYPLSAWIDIPDSTTVGSGAVLAGLRVIFDANNNDLRGGGIESALIYAQTWASAGQIDSGLFIAAGAGTTIDSLIEFGSPGSRIGSAVIDLTSWGEDTPMTLLLGGPSDNAGAHLKICAGDQTDHAGIVSEVGGASNGSLYLSTSGALFCKVAGTWTDVV